MGYRPKIVLCRLKTGGKSIKEFREKFKDQGMSDFDLKNIQKAYEKFDGLTVLLSMWEYDNHESYHLYDWNLVDDEAMMQGIYFAEQSNPFTQYKDNFDKFAEDWKDGEYDSGGAVLTFSPEEVKELKIISEENRS